MPHEELGAEELGGDERAILGKANLVGGEFAPLCEEPHNLTVGAQNQRTLSTNISTSFTALCLVPWA